MAKAKLQSDANSKTFVISEKMRRRIPRVGDEAYILKEEDAEETAPEGKVINDLTVTTFAVLMTVIVGNTMLLEGGKVLRVNGTDFSMEEKEDGEEDVFEMIYNDKDEAIEAWKRFMDQRVLAAKEKLAQYQRLVDFLDNQIKSELY